MNRAGQISGARVVVALTSTLAAVGADLWWASAQSAAVVCAAMAVIWLWSASAIRPVADDALHGRNLRDLVRFEVGLVVAGGAVVLARAFIAWEQVRGQSEQGVIDAARVYDLAFLALALVSELVSWRARLFARLLAGLGSRPPLLLAASFATMIAVGTLLLSLPWSLTSLARVSVIDALFTSTSAVCVTGLVVNDVGTTYTPFGQLVLLLLIQFGGLGIMTLGAAAVTLRSSASLHLQAHYASVLDAGDLGELRALVRTVVTSTLLIEALGALALATAWAGHPALEGRSLAWNAVFHSISAFCNAGFALFPGNLALFTSSTSTQLAIMVLIVLGGIGFPVYRVLAQRARQRLARALTRRAIVVTRLGITARTVLISSAFLIGFGALAALALEGHGALAGLPWPERFLAALFASVTARTAGFSTLDFGTFSSPLLLVTIVLMWIGGSPSSTAGGIKTTTAATLFATFAGEMRRHAPRLGGRELGSETIRRATAVAGLSIATIATVLFLLTLCEDLPFLSLAFESVSAFGTVGLSTGITPQLSALGRVVLSAAMFVGRTGPMTVALAIGARRSRERFRLPRDDLAIW